MESEGKRRIRSGKEYDHLFPPPSDEDITIKKDANVEDTIRLMQRAVPQTLWQTEKIARKLKGKTLEETCSNIWHFVYGHIQYQRDKDGVEQVRSPRRTWWDRDTGVDCDCYTVFISSILLNLKIPHVIRITKYPKKPPETPRWQHVYPIVPRDRKLAIGELAQRDDYIVLDCVKDDYDDEQPYLECKDYDMRLEYLDGLGDTDETEMFDELEFDTIDAQDMAELYGSDLGILKKLRKKVGSAVKSVAKKVGETAKKVGDKVGQGVRLINRYVNPATLLLRNGFLLAMKNNMMNVGGRLRYAYLTDEQAKAKGINVDILKKLRAIKDRAETVYWQAGGKKANLKKAILGGRGNRDKKVPLSGLHGLDEVYMDLDEYNIIHGNPYTMEGLGELASGTALAAASGAVTAIATALKQIKGLFAKGGSEEQAFQSETHNADNDTASESVIPEDEDALVDRYEYETPGTSSVTVTRALPATTEQSSTSVSPSPNPQEPPQGIVQKTTGWIKENPGKSVLIAGAALAGGYLLFGGRPGGSGTAGLSGLPKTKKKKRNQKKKKRNKRSGKLKIKSIKL